MFARDPKGPLRLYARLPEGALRPCCSFLSIELLLVLRTARAQTCLIRLEDSSTRHRCQRSLRLRVRRVSSCVLSISSLTTPERRLRIHRIHAQPNSGSSHSHRWLPSVLASRRSRWLALSLRLDGRHDTHPPERTAPTAPWWATPACSSGSDVLSASAQLARPQRRHRRLDPRDPGAPSIQASATSVDLKLLASHQLQSREPGPVLGTLGFRLDHSARECTVGQEQNPVPGRLSLAQSQRLQRTTRPCSARAVA